MAEVNLHPSNGAVARGVPGPVNTNYQENEIKKPVVKGTVHVDKPRFSKKVINFLFSDKIDSIGNYLITSILGPDLKNLVFRMVTGGVQMALFGGNTVSGYPGPSPYVPGYNGYQNARRDPIPYNTMGAPGYQYGYAQPQPTVMTPRIDISNISFDTKDDAWRVLDRMGHELRRYGKVRVADFYTFAGVTGQDGNWVIQGTGWYDLNGANPVMRTDGRWIIQFPPIQNLH